MLNNKMIKDILISSVPIIIIFIIILISPLGKLNNFSIDNFLQYIIIAPILEEYIFRGTLQPYINNRINIQLGYLSFGNILVSIFFGTLHMFSWSVVYGIMVIFPSLIFGLLYDRNKSILPSIFVHGIYNLNIFINY